MFKSKTDLNADAFELMFQTWCDDRHKILNSTFLYQCEWFWHPLKVIG